MSTIRKLSTLITLTTLCCCAGTPAERGGLSSLDQDGWVLLRAEGTVQVRLDAQEGCAQVAETRVAVHADAAPRVHPERGKSYLLDSASPTRLGGARGQWVAVRMVGELGERICLETEATAPPPGSQYWCVPGDTPECVDLGEANGGEWARSVRTSF